MIVAAGWSAAQPGIAALARTSACLPVVTRGVLSTACCAQHLLMCGRLWPSMGHCKSLGTAGGELPTSACLREQAHHATVNCILAALTHLASPSTDSDALNIKDAIITVEGAC